MRQRLLLFLAFALTLASACKKEDDDEQTIPYIPPYRVSGVVDFSIQKTSSGINAYEMYVGMEYENGEQERVSLSLENVPPGLHDTIYTVSGYPSFSSYIRFVDSGAAVGTYSVKFVTTGDKSGRREYPFSIRVLPEPDCSAPLLGIWNTQNNCGGPNNYSINIQASPTITNRVLLSNFNNDGTQFYAQAECGGSGGGSTYFNIPNQIINGISYSGYGYYNPNQSQPGISMNVSRSNFGTCTYYLSR